MPLFLCDFESNRHLRKMQCILCAVKSVMKQQQNKIKKKPRINNKYINN